MILQLNVPFVIQKIQNWLASLVQQHAKHCINVTIAVNHLIISSAIKNCIFKKIDFMTIVIKTGDSSTVIKKKLEQAEKRADELRRKEIQDLCGILKNEISNDPVKLIRKMRDEEWS